MRIDYLLEDLERQAAMSQKEGQITSEAAAIIQVLDGTLGLVVKEVEVVTVDAIKGWSTSTCLDMIELYPGLRFRHNSKILPYEEPDE